MRLTVLVAVLALAGCGTVTKTTGVQPMGPDTFSVASDALKPSTARSHALGQANAHCSAAGRDILVTNTRGASVGSREVFTVTFRCLAKGDPELQRPVYVQPATAVIEDRRR